MVLSLNSCFQTSQSDKLVSAKKEDEFLRELVNLQKIHLDNHARLG